VHPEFFFVFPVRVTPSRVMMNDNVRHVFPFVTIQIKMFCNWFGDSLGLNGYSVVINSSAEITCFTYVLFLTFLATD
jgi:hypothetical protein